MLTNFALGEKIIAVKGRCHDRSDVDSDKLELCGDKDDDGKLVDDQVCLCETDLCNAFWKNSATTTTGTAMALVSILVVIFLH